MNLSVSTDPPGISEEITGQDMKRLYAGDRLSCDLPSPGFRLHVTVTTCDHAVQLPHRGGEP
jgi:hypothetical protein